MKYNPPYGSTNPNAHYVDRDTPNAIQGSRIPAKAVEDPQKEIVAVITSTGLTADPDDNQQMLKALQIIFGRPRIYPEVLGTGGRFGVFAPATGTIRIPGGTSIIIRGLTRYVSQETDFPTTASKTYHLRWDAVNGFRLLPMSSSTYNPGGLPEDDASFDSAFEDILAARIVTNGANVAVITDLSNRDRLNFNGLVAGTDAFQSGLNGANFRIDRALNWGRTPSNYTLAAARVSYANTAGDNDINFTDQGQTRTTLTTAPTVIPVNRYGLSCFAMWDFATQASFQFSARD